ncbi:MAG TPA: alpha-L-arabinofuranosidase C-terminal domain-containing protein [Acidimicrobiales bacterium]|nr:alpha-L-arabinofuranosidase C-terminal domain-containing protein [Acidimicrobiales bacterium]
MTSAGKLTTLTVHPSFTIAPVDERIFGGFLEHLGRAVYGGVLDPTSAHADAHGCRRDVLDALAALRMTAMRYPGGNFVSGYHWRDGIGPPGERPTVREPAWKSVETNRFGTHEFLDLCERMGWTPMLAVNLGTGTPEKAADWVEYCTGSFDTRLVDERRANGRAEPWTVPLWCLGNEMDGSWQLGHSTAREYGVRAQQAAMQMRLVNPAIETVACGSSMVDAATYGTWDREVLEVAGDQADFLSLHRYVGNLAGNLDDYLAVGAAIDHQIAEADAICRAVQATLRSAKRAQLCFDEWNVWYRNFDMDGGWAVAPPLLEEHYDLADALVVAQFLMAFIRRADVVKIANLAQVVNVLAPMLTRGDELLLQSTYHAFRMISQRRDGTALHVAHDGPTRSSAHGTVAVVDAAAVLADDALHVFVVNRSPETSAPVRLLLPGAEPGVLRSGELLWADRHDAANTWDRPDAVTPQPFHVNRTTDGERIWEMPPHSFAALTFER